MCYKNFNCTTCKHFYSEFEERKSCHISEDMQPKYEEGEIVYFGDLELIIRQPILSETISYECISTENPDLIYEVDENKLSKTRE